MQNDEVQQETVGDNDADKINQVPTVSDAINALSTLQSFLERGRDVSSPVIWATKISAHLGDKNVAQMSRSI